MRSYSIVGRQISGLGVRAACHSTRQLAFQLEVVSVRVDFLIMNLPNLSDCGNHPLGTSSSSTFIDQQTPFGIFYGTGAVNGTVVRDTVSMAGFTLTGHQFGAASRESAQFAG